MVVGHNENNKEAAEPEVLAEVGRRTILIIIFNPDEGLIDEDRWRRLRDMYNFFLD